MSEFVGRTGSHRGYSYPETGRRAGAPSAFARNFATGPKTTTAIGLGGLPIPWNSIDVAPITPSSDVPITPLSTGVVRISGVVTVHNPSDASPTPAVIINISLNNGSFLPAQSSFIPPLLPGQAITVPFLAETTPTDTPVGVTTTVQVFVDGDPGGAELLASASAIEVQEVAVSTG